MPVTSGPTATNPDPATGSSRPNAGVHIGGNVTGNIIVGDNNIINEYHTEHGNIINYHTPAAVKPRDVKPRPPRSPSGFVGRGLEIKTLERLISDQKPALIQGPDGIGKSALIRQAANSDAAKGLRDGVILVENPDDTGSSLGLDDIIQQVFDALYESNPPLKVNSQSGRTYLSNNEPLVIIDRYDIPDASLDNLANSYRDWAIVTSRNQISFADQYELINLGSLDRDESIELFSSMCGVDANASNPNLISEICELLGDVPLAIVKTARLIRQKKVKLEKVVEVLRQIRPPSQNSVQAAIERSYALIFYNLDHNERDLLIHAASVPGISVSREWLESVSDSNQTLASIENLELVQANSPRLRISKGLKHAILSSTQNYQVARENFLADILRKLEVYTLDFDFVGNELGNILGLIQWATIEGRWKDVISLGRAVDPYLMLHGLWDAWKSVLEQIENAGETIYLHGKTEEERTLGRSTHAWALHQLGSREAGVGSIANAIKYLIHALRIRESLGDGVGTAYTRHNLNIIITLKPPKPEKSLLERIISAVKNLSRINPWVLIPFILTFGILIWMLFYPPPPKSDCPIPEDWQIYQSQKGETLDSISQRVASSLGIEEKEIPVLKIAMQNAISECGENETPPDRPIPVPVDPATLTVPPPTEATSQLASIRLELSSQPKIISEPRQMITYIYDIQNAGDASMPGSLSISDSKSAEIRCPDINSIGNLDENFDPDERITCSSTYDVTQTDVDRGVITNESHVSNNDVISNTATNIVEVAQEPGITIEKAADPIFYTQVGQDITYTYTVLNSGNVTLTPIQINLRDVFSNGKEENVICGADPTELAPGASTTCRTIYTITQADIDSGSVSNQASVSIHAYGYNLMGNRNVAFTGEHTATTTVYYALPLILEKTADHETFDTVDQEITYTYAITNTNNMHLSGPITVDDNNVEVSCPDIRTLPPTLTPTLTPSLNPTITTFPALDLTRTPSALLIEPTPTATQPITTPAPTITVNDPDERLEPNETIHCSGTYRITQKDLDFGSVTNDAVAHVGEVASNLVNLTIKAMQRREIELTKSAEPGIFNQVGEVITYTYTIVNKGNVTLEGIFVIQDDHINGNNPFNCNPESDSLPPGDRITCDAKYSILIADLERRSVTNKAVSSLGSLISTASETISCPYPPAPWVPYVVLQGDTLYSISTSLSDLGTTVSELQRRNCKPTTSLITGEVLYVPRSPTGIITGYVFADLDRDNNWNPSVDKGIPGVEVSVLNLDTQNTYTTRTNSGGLYYFSGLPAGRYRVFQFPTKELLLNAGETENANFAIIPAE